MIPFDEHYRQVIAEAAAEGPAAVAVLRLHETGNGNPTLKTLGALTGALGVELSIAERSSARTAPGARRVDAR